MTQAPTPAPKEPPPNTPTDDEAVLLRRLLEFDQVIRDDPNAPHIGNNPGDGLITFLSVALHRSTGVF